MNETRDKKSHVWKQSDDQWYVEDASCTRALLRVEKFSGPIWDPCCGGGNVVIAGMTRCIEIIGTDIKARVDNDQWWFYGEYDFLHGDLTPLTEHSAPWNNSQWSIVTNPPFFRAVGTEQAIRRALDVAKHKVCIFTDVKFLSGGKRATGLYTECPPHRIWHLSPRPSCPPGEYLAAGNKAGGRTADYCWLVWDNLSPYTGTQTGWLRILPEDHK